jgi:hypothetical protein
MYSGVPKRPSGMLARTWSAAVGERLAVIGVVTGPGATALTVMWWDASSGASDLVNPSTPAFAAAFADHGREVNHATSALLAHRPGHLLSRSRSCR